MKRRFIASTATEFRWRPPEADILVASADVTIAWAAGEQTYTLEARSGDTITAISADRTRVTVEWGADGALTTMPAGQPTPVWLSFGARVQIPSQVVRVVSVTAGPPAGGVLELDRPLPLDVSAGGAVEYLSMSAAVSSLHVPATPQTVKWSVLYSPIRNGATLDNRIDRGVLDVVRAPFATGLTHARLMATSPHLSLYMPSGHASFAPQIEVALDALVARIRTRLAAGQSVDMLAGAQFQNAHAMETQLVILRGVEQAGRSMAEQIEALDGRVYAGLTTKGLIERELDRIWAGGLDWLDADDDGALDAGETGTRPALLSVVSHVTNTAIWDRADTDAETPDAWARSRITDPR